MFIKRMLPAILLVITMTFSALPVAQAAVNNGFTDLKSDSWAYQSVTDMTRRGVISGYEDGSFRPDNSITREEFAALITKTFLLDTTVTQEVYYTDVLPDRWSYKDINASKNYLAGYHPPNGKSFFDPEAKATREDVAVAIVKASGFAKNDLKNKEILNKKFSDVDKISFGLRDYVAIATERNLINGYSDGTFGPDKTISRAEVAALLYRSIKNLSEDNTSKPTTNSQTNPTPAAGQDTSNQSPVVQAKPEINAPQLTLDLSDKSSVMYYNSKKLMVEFYFKDKNDSLPIFFINGQKHIYNVRSNYADDTYRCYFDLELTSNNEFSFKLVNKYGKESNTVTQSVY